MLATAAASTPDARRRLRNELNVILEASRAPVWNTREKNRKEEEEEKIFQNRVEQLGGDYCRFVENKPVFEYHGCQDPIEKCQIKIKKTIKNKSNKSKPKHQNTYHWNWP
jgi:hypothetical protein